MLTISVFETLLVTEFLGYFEDTIHVSEGIETRLLNQGDAFNTESINVGENITAVTSSPGISVFDGLNVTEGLLFVAEFYLNVTENIAIGDTAASEGVMQAAVSDEIQLGEWFDYDYTKFATQLGTFLHSGFGRVNNPTGRTW